MQQILVLLKLSFEANATEPYPNVNIVCKKIEKAADIQTTFSQKCINDN